MAAGKPGRAGAGPPSANGTSAKEDAPTEPYIVVQVSADGRIEVTPHGVSQLEAPTLLKLGAKACEKQLGISD